MKAKVKARKRSWRELARALRVSHGHLHLVVHGKRRSKRLMESYRALLAEEVAS
jgi:hypothetical protein